MKMVAYLHHLSKWSSKNVQNTLNTNMIIRILAGSDVLNERPKGFKMML